MTSKTLIVTCLPPFDSQDDETPNIQIRFGQEALVLDSWCRKKQYDAFCAVLGSGVNLHLAENELVRDVLELGPRLSPLNSAALKASKQERVSSYIYSGMVLRPSGRVVIF